MHIVINGIIAEVENIVTDMDQGEDPFEADDDDVDEIEVDDPSPFASPVVSPHLSSGSCQPRLNNSSNTFNYFRS